MTDRTQHCCACEGCAEDHGGRCGGDHRATPPLPDAVEARRMQGCCMDCGRKYGDEYGFPDLVVSPEAWRALSPTRDEGGLLCPSCMCRRAHDAGLEVSAKFRSGPFNDDACPSCQMWSDRVAALTAERDALAERVRGVEDHDCDRWRSEGLGCRLCNPVADEPEERDRQTRIEALEWALARIKVYYPLLKIGTAAMGDIEAEIARLRAEQRENLS